MTPPDPGQLALGFGFAIVAIAVITWILVIIRELPEGAPELNEYVTRISHFIFDAAPAQADVQNSSLPVKIIVKGIIPIVFWLLIVVPLVIFPVVFIIMPLLHIPWTYLLPPAP